MQPRCIAFATNRTRDLPVRKPKKTSPEKHSVMLAIIDNGQVLLEQRPPTGIWGGLLSLLEIDVLSPDDVDAAEREERLAPAVALFDLAYARLWEREAREASGDSESNLAHVLVVVHPQVAVEQNDRRGHECVQ